MKIQTKIPLLLERTLRAPKQALLFVGVQDPCRRQFVKIVLIYIGSISQE